MIFLDSLKIDLPRQSGEPTFGNSKPAHNQVLGTGFSEELLLVKEPQDNNDYIFPL